MVTTNRFIDFACFFFCVSFFSIIFFVCINVYLYIWYINAKTDNYYLVYELNEDNWTDMLEGEWMVLFCTPWYPACASLEPAWRELATLVTGWQPWWLADVKVGTVDAMQSPVLTARFLVMHLPAIIHVSKGRFRWYKGRHHARSMAAWVIKKKWKARRPLPRWRSPDSRLMAALSPYCDVHPTLRVVHNWLMQTFGLSTWGAVLLACFLFPYAGSVLFKIIMGEPYD